MPTISRAEGGQLQPTITVGRDSPPDDRSPAIRSRVDRRSVITKRVFGGQAPISDEQLGAGSRKYERLAASHLCAERVNQLLQVALK
jgi:hypothetical protein